VSLQVQDVDTLMMDLRTKFLRVLEEEPVQPLVLDDAEGEALELSVTEVAAADAEAVDFNADDPSHHPVNDTDPDSRVEAA